ncbi:RnfABCDGE type electron transport complex subunit D [Elusimicrobiota bacterium]
MNKIIERIHISPAPHIKAKLHLEHMMWWTVFALLFPVIGSVYLFGNKALLLILVCVASSMFFDISCRFVLGLKISVKDGSAVVTGIILALVLPPSFPLWAAVLGSLFSIFIVKYVYGGLGKNVFNPALMGRAFLTAAFPVLITTYTTVPRSLPFFKPAGAEISVNAVSEATPLGRAKFEKKEINKSNMLRYFFGERKGSLGETSSFLIIIGLSILLIKGVADWRLPLSYFVSVFVFSLLLWIADPVKFIDPLLSMMLGGILLGGTFMLTDPVTTPVTTKGKYVFGIGAAVFTLLIRNWSGYPEGVMFSIILMNALTPLINRYTKPRIYGTV